MKIRFNKPYISNKELFAIGKVLKSGKISGNCGTGQKVETYLEKILEIKHAFLTTSCTHALEMSMQILNLKEGDEVILPSFNFVSSANAILKVKAKPVFVEIENNTLNIDPDCIEKSITNKTRVIICVHYAGRPCAMGRIQEIAKRNNIFLVEDAAQAIGSKYQENFLGTIGDIGCFSFHGTKNLTCGEGGVFLTDNHNFAKKAEIIREKGTNRTEFLKGKVDKYTWHDVGSSYVLSDILAVMLYEQIKKMKKIIKMRKEVYLNYSQQLSKFSSSGQIIVPDLPKDEYNWHSFYFRIKEKKGKRDSLIRSLRKKGIEATHHFIPLHTSPYAKLKLGYKKGDFPITEKASDTIIRLPVYPDLPFSSQKFIIKTLGKILKN